MPPTSRRRLAAACLTAALIAVLVPATTAGAAVPVPPTPTVPTGIEALSAYVGADSCDASTKPGTAALGSLLTRTYPGTSYGSARACGSDSLATSEHYDGRAVDWMTNVRNTTQRGYAQAAIAWMLAKDKAGNEYAMARRLGVMYLIWNNRTWSAYRPQDGWKEYSGCLSTAKASTAYDTTCHRNHVHISLSWAGAMKRTSYWSAKVAVPEYGPCRPWYLSWAPPRTSVNPTRCQTPPAVKALSATSSLGKQLVSASGVYLKQGSTGPVVKAVQSAIGTSATSSFSSTTRSALLAWQKRNKVPATGVTDAATWRALIRVHAAPPVALGLDSTIDSDLVSLAEDGTVTLHDSPSDPTGRVVATGWSTTDQVLTPGDFTSDTVPDLITRRTDGTLLLHPGSGDATFGAALSLGRGWNMFDVLFTPGDFTGDGRPDVIGRKPDGTLWLYTGNGSAWWTGSARRINAGWGIFDTVFSPGDFTGDGRPDLIARKPDGTLWLYAGNGRGGFAGSGRKIGNGWQMFTSVFAAGDTNRDGYSDLLGVTEAGGLRSYRGNGRGGWASGGGQDIGRDGWGTAKVLVGAR